MIACPYCQHPVEFIELSWEGHPGSSGSDCDWVKGEAEATCPHCRERCRVWVKDWYVGDCRTEITDAARRSDS